MSGNSPDHGTETDMVHEGQGGYSGPPQHGTGGWGSFPPPPPGPVPPPAPAHFSAPHPQAQPGPSVSTILSLVCNILALCGCYGALPALVGTVLSIIAMTQARTDPDSARKLTVGAWICFGVALVFLVVTVVLYLVYGAVLLGLGSSGSSSYYYY